MSEFEHEIRDRIESARLSLDEARREGDDYLIQVRLGELDSLERLAAQNEPTALAL